MDRESKNEYYKNYFTKHKYNIAKIWEGIKEIINTKNNKRYMPYHIEKGSETITDPEKNSKLL